MLRYRAAHARRDRRRPQPDSLDRAEGSWQHAADPQPIATGSGGSPWPVLGDLLVERLGVPIGFVSVGWGGTSIDQWQPDAPSGFPQYGRLRDALEALGSGGARAVLWHQGESDVLAETSSQEYASQLRRVIAESRGDAGYDVLWGVALTSYLPTASLSVAAREAILQAQQQVIDEDPLVFLGPATDDLIGPDWRRGGGGHFNEAGLREHARRWAAAVSVLWVPEPGGFFLLAFGAWGMLAVARRRARSETAPA